MLYLAPEGTRILTVHGEIKGEEVYLSNCIVLGNVRGNNVSIGPNVEIKGIIEYSETLEISEKAEKEYEASQIEAGDD